ncbi:MAG: TetR/AcrR family transcriptional regulator [Flavobacteriia bacterium]|nr:TetR/AcrR family transcriptional regulator [Flavobacteriia bacterium]NBP29602.1 TetR/AcrR family transcriptional regulator [Flavobacteriia bacterium]
MKLKDSSTEDKILEAAKSEFLEFGLYGARMQSIANRAGMNKALLHYYFRNKEKLFDKVFESALERYFSNMDVLSEEQLDFKERVHRLADRFLDFLTEYPQMALFLIKEVSANQALFIEKVEKSQKGNTTLLKALMDANRKGLISVQDPMLFFVQLISLCTYPFVAKPLFSVIAERNETTWNSDSLTVLRASIHSFIDHQINPT